MTIKNCGIQFSSARSDSTSSEFSVLNTQPNNTGVQWDITQNKSTDRQLQFKKIGQIPAVNDDSYLDFFAYLDDETYLGFNYKKNIGVQFESVGQNNLSLEFKALLYNDTQFRYMDEFASRGTSGDNWTATSTATSSSQSFDTTNLNTDIVEQVWRSTSTSQQTLLCDTENSSGVFVDTIAILNHNLTRSAQIDFQGSSTSDFSNVGVSITLESNDKNIYYVAPEAPLQGFRYYRFVITDATNSDPYFEIGTIVFGSAKIFNFKENVTDQISFAIKQYEDTIKTEGYTNISNDRGQKSLASFSFKDLVAEDFNFRTLRGTFVDVGTLLKVLWILVPQNIYQTSLFAKMTSLPKEKHVFMGKHYVSLSINVDESK